MSIGDRAVRNGSFAAFSLLLALSACTPDTRPNVVLVTLDTTRADRIGPMGDADGSTPTLDALAARGVVFERAYASAPLTLPSHATMLTGLDPNRHGIHDNGRFRLPAELETIAESLSGARYDTGAFVAALVLDAAFGLDQGFDVYDDETPLDFDDLRPIVPRRNATEVTNRALEWLADRDGDGPFLLWVHYYDVHAPRVPPPPFDAHADPYRGAVAYVDAEVGRLLEVVDGTARGRETVVIVVGDHGESLGEHDEASHGIVAYDSTLHVPLIAAGPGFPRGRRSPVFARTADVAPTILRAAGLGPTAEGAHALQDLAAGDTEPPNRIAYFESRGPFYSLGWARLSGVRDARWKLTVEPEPIELYDVIDDPGETRNVAPAEPGVVTRLAEAHRRLPRSEPAPGVGALADLAEKLSALGYLATSHRREETESSPDPRRFVGAMTWLDRALAVAAEGRVPEAIEALRILSEPTPTRPVALDRLAGLYAAAGREDDAIEALEAAFEETGAVDRGVRLVKLLLLAGRIAEATALLDALTESPEDPRGRLLRARMRLAEGFPEDAAASASAVLAEDPSSDAALALLAEARAAADGHEAEIARLTATLSARTDAPRLVATRWVLARLLHERGRDSEAVRFLDEPSNDARPAPVEHALLLADIHATRDDGARVATVLEATVRQYPAERKPRVQLAEVLLGLGRSRDSLEHWSVLERLDPTDPAILVGKGVALLGTGRLEEAETLFRKVLALDPEIAEAHWNLSIVASRRDDDEAAERHLVRAVEIRPDHAKAHLRLAELYQAREDPRAKEHLDAAIDAAGR